MPPGSTYLHCAQEVSPTILQYLCQAQVLSAARDLDSCIFARALCLDCHSLLSNSFQRGGDHGLSSSTEKAKSVKWAGLISEGEYCTFSVCPACSNSHANCHAMCYGCTCLPVLVKPLGAAFVRAEVWPLSLLVPPKSHQSCGNYDSVKGPIVQASTLKLI